MAHYLRENFYITTGGNFRTQALTDVLLEVGADRVLYSVDYPFDEMTEAASWIPHGRNNNSPGTRCSLTHGIRGPLE